MKLIFLAFILFAVVYSDPCPTPTNVTYVCGKLGENCTSNATYVVQCNYPLICDFFTTKQCSNPGVTGQPCASVLDCQNVSGKNGMATHDCINGTCQESGYAGVGESCTDDKQCASTSCNKTSFTCATAMFVGCNEFTGGLTCPFGQYCNASFSGSCVDSLVEGANCTSDKQCAGLMGCIGGKCANFHSVALDGTCKVDQQCDGCNGCTGCTKRRLCGAVGGSGGDPDHVGLWTLLSLRDLELDPLSLFQGAVAVHLDRAVVDEHVRTTVYRDEAVSLLRVEPLDGALSHSKLPYCWPFHEAALSRTRVILRRPHPRAMGGVRRNARPPLNVSGRTPCATGHSDDKLRSVRSGQVPHNS